MYGFRSVSEPCICAKLTKMVHTNVRSMSACVYFCGEAHSSWLDCLRVIAKLIRVVYPMCQTIVTFCSHFYLGVLSSPSACHTSRRRCLADPYLKGISCPQQPYFETWRQPSRSPLIYLGYLSWCIITTGPRRDGMPGPWVEFV